MTMGRVIFLFLILFLPKALFGGDMMDEFSAFHHSSVILEVDEVLDKFGHPKEQFVVEVLRGSQPDVDALARQLGISQGPSSRAKQRRVHLYRKKSDGTFEPMDIYIQGQPVERGHKGYEAYKSWLKFFGGYMTTHTPKREKSGNFETLVFSDPAVCGAVRKNDYFKIRYDVLLSREEGFRLGGWGGDYAKDFQPLVAVDCRVKSA